jgi:hypothetical protein
MTVTRTRMDFAHLSVGWEAEARQWIQWARTPEHDSYWRFHRDQFLRLLPPPGRQALDIGWKILLGDSPSDRAIGGRLLCNPD